MRLAEAELQRHEFAYLFVSMITPFAGAALLRTVLGLVNGVDSISWFSTTLFVLAAGVRPWGHLISRLRERTISLHDSIHYPSPDTQFIPVSRLQAVVDRMNSLEQELLTVKRAMAMRAYVEEVHDDLSSALQGAERAIRKQERKSESVRISYDTRFTTLEKAVSRIERARGERIRVITPGSGNATSSGVTDDRACSRLESILTSIFRRRMRIAGYYSCPVGTILTQRAFARKAFRDNIVVLRLLSSACLIALLLASSLPSLLPSSVFSTDSVYLASLLVLYHTDVLL